MGQDEPLVSVVVSLYNARSFIAEALQSLLNQTHRNLEIIVVDDGSTDGGGEVVTALRDSRLRYIRQFNQGPSGCLNRGIRESRGEYLTILSGDDVALPHRIERSLRACREEKVPYVFGTVELIDERSEVIAQVDESWTGVSFPALNLSQPELVERLFSQWNFLNATTFFCRRDALPAEPFAPGLLQLQDYELWIRLAARSRFYVVEEALCRYRLRSFGDNLSSPTEPALYRTQAERSYMYSRVFSELSDSLFNASFGKHFRQPLGGALFDRDAEEIHLLARHGHVTARVAAYAKLQDLLRKSDPVRQAKLIEGYAFDTHSVFREGLRFRLVDFPALRDPPRFRASAYYGEPYDESRKLQCEYSLDEFGRFQWCLDVSGVADLGKFRLDLWEGPYFRVELDKLVLVDEKGDQISLSPDTLENNAVTRRGKFFLFATSDPWFIIPDPRRGLRRIEARGRICSFDGDDATTLGRFADHLVASTRPPRLNFWQRVRAALKLLLRSPG